MMSKTKQLKNSNKRIIVLFALVLFCSALYAQTEFQGGWSLDAGFGMTNILVKGTSYQAIVDPKIWLSPSLMIGNKFGVNYSTDQILAFENQAYLRWNFLHSGTPEKQVDFFLQGGIGLLAMYRGTDSMFSDAKKTRGSMMFDAAAGVTIPLASNWHIEPQIRAGYPHIFGFSITAGYKFPVQQKASRREILSANEIIKHIQIASVDSIMFGPDTEEYNVNIDQDAMELNENALNTIAKTLKDNPDFRVRIEGHANPVTHAPGETESLMRLSRTRAEMIAGRLNGKGVAEDQMVIAAFGGTRTIANDTRNINRRVELIVVQVNTNL